MSPVVEQGENELQVCVAEASVQAHQLAQRQQRRRAQHGAGVAQAPARAKRITSRVHAYACCCFCEASRAHHAQRISLSHGSFSGLDTRHVQSACELRRKESASFCITQMAQLNQSPDLPLVTEGSNEGGEAANEVCAAQYLSLCGILEAIQLSIRRCAARAQLSSDVIVLIRICKEEERKGTWCLSHRSPAGFTEKHFFVLIIRDCALYRHFWTLSEPL